MTNSPAFTASMINSGSELEHLKKSHVIAVFTSPLFLIVKNMLMNQDSAWRDHNTLES